MVVELADANSVGLAGDHLLAGVGTPHSVPDSVRPAGHGTQPRRRQALDEPARALPAHEPGRENSLQEKDHGTLGHHRRGRRKDIMMKLIFTVRRTLT